MSESDLLPPVFLLTAPGRGRILAETLVRRVATDWPGTPLVVVDTAPRSGEALTRIPAAWRSMLVRALAVTDAPHLLLLAREFAAAALREWTALPGFPSMRLATLADRLGRPIHYHRPSLVQHTGTVSSWGGHIHRAVDFENRTAQS